MTPAFYKPISAGPRPWGEERIVALVPGVASCKLLKVKAGHKGRLQRHHRKDEAGYLLEGEMLVRWVSDGQVFFMELYAGDSYHFPVGCIHQEEAVTDCTVIEVSTPFGNDREGMEEEFGMEVPVDALPSTTLEEVTTLDAWW